ncbi:MAG: ATP-binding protein [Pseudomonadota bacterium]
MTSDIVDAKRWRFDGLARRLIVSLILFSSLITALITAIDLYSDYQRDIAGIDNRMHFIRESYLPTLVESVWVADSMQINAQLEGLSRLQDIEYIAISIAEQKRWSAGTLRSNRRIASDIPLVRSYRNQNVTIGTLHIVASVDNVVDRLWTKLVETLLTNLAKTLLVALFMLYLFQRLAGRHLVKIAQHLRLLGREPGSEQTLQLDRPVQSRWRPDTLDGVVTAVNSMHRNVSASHAQILALNAELERRVAERTHDLELSKNDAERANAAKSEFLSRMSHELRTPLNAIIGFSKLLETDTAHPLVADQADNVQEILHAGHHLLELINEVLDLARIESGRLELIPEPVSASQLVNECAALMRPLAAQQGIQLSSKTGSCAIQADKLRLRQILLNLLSNAIKYNHAGGSVEIACHSAPEGWGRIAVRDSGRGIAADALPRLFKPFERMESAYEAIEGSGIGLALCKKLAEAMGGVIGVESTIGEGSTFWVEFPLALAKAADPVATTNIQHTQPVNAAERTLLYIEDNPANQRLVQKIIATRTGLTLLLAHSAELGLNLASTHQPDLILLDINLPGMDGFEALRQLQQDPATRAIPVIAITANAMPSDVKKGLEAGFVDYMTKPLDVARFLSLVDHLLSGRNLS